MDGIALKAAMTLPSLMLQKPHAKSKTHDHISCLQRRLNLWRKETFLEDKHPDPKPAHPEALLGDAVDSFHPVIFESITADSIRTAALHTQGAAGPSGLDAINWRRLCTAFG